MAIQHWCVGALLLLLAGCSATRIDLPGIAAGSDGRQLPGKVIWHDLLSDTPEQSMAFYRALFDWEFEPVRAADGYILIRHRGRPIGGLVDQRRLETPQDVSQWVVVMSVVDLDRAVATVADSGGQVLTPPLSLGARGDIAVVADNQGAPLALLQTREGDPSDAGPPPAQGDFLWDELWARDVDSAGAFYGRLFGYAEESRQFGDPSNPLTYRVLSAGGRPRAGLRERPAEDLAPTWVTYLRVADVDRLRGIVEQVDGLGGSVLLPVTERPAGGHLAVIRGPSGAGIALQTWHERQQYAAGEAR